MKNTELTTVTTYQKPLSDPNPRIVQKKLHFRKVDSFWCIRHFPGGGHHGNK